jgi:hypothetical protein
MRKTAMDRAYLLSKIESIKSQIDSFENALFAFSENGALQSYTIDTGQTRQTVNRSEIGLLNSTIDSLYNRLTVFESRLYGGNTLQARPYW